MSVLAGAEDGAERVPARSETGGALVPFAVVHEETFRAATQEPAAPAKRDWRRLGAAASLAGLALIGAAATTAHVMNLRGGDGLAQRLDAMSARLEAVEATRTRDELANLRKVLTEIKAGATSSKEAAGAVTQLAARVDKLEKEQGARLDKLGDRIDHDTAARLAEVTARLEKLEAKAPLAVAAVPSPPLKPQAKADTPKAEPAVSNETTGSLEKPKPRLRGFYLAEIHNGYAMIDSPDGEFNVGPGDTVPGGGRVLRIERRGRDWVVVTTQGTIASE